MENNLDHLFKRKLEEQEPAFTPAAWERMDQLLDEEGFVPKKEKPRRAVLIIIPIFILGLLTISLGYYSMTGDLNDEGSALDQTKMETSQILTNNHTIQSKALNEEENVDATSEKVLNKSKSGISTETFKTEMQPPNHLTIENEIERNQIEIKGTNPVGTTESSDGLGETSAVYAAETTIKDQLKNGELNQKAEGTHVFNSKSELNASSSSSSSSSSLNTEDTTNALDEKVEDLKSVLISDLKVESTSGKEVTQARPILPNMTLLTLNSKLLGNPHAFVSPTIRVKGSGVFRAGLELAIRNNDGLGYALGAFGDFNVGRGFQIGLSAQYDAQVFGAGPSITVSDKRYSFGSTITERTFALNQQKSLKLGLKARKGYGPMTIIAGVNMFKPFETLGDISASSDGELTEGISIENESIRTISFGFEAGAAISLTRHIEVNAGLEMRSSAFSSEENVTNTKTNLYPTLGLRYKLIKL